jgi:hypothetical protein
MKKKSSTVLIKTVVLVYLFLLGNSNANSQTPVLESHWWQPNLAVFAIAIDSMNHVAYLGGNFSKIAPPIKVANHALLDTSRAIPDFSFIKANGNINLAIPDGGGGWYVGGLFSKVGDSTRNYLAQISFDGKVTSWNPSPNDRVTDMIKLGNKVFISGQFGYIGGKVRNYLAAVDLNQGLASTWNPNPDGAVWRLASNSTTIFASGYFQSIGGQTRNWIASIDVTTGAINSWNANASAGTVISSMVVSGNNIYIGGSFNQIGGQYRKNLASISLTTGLASSWNPAPNQPVEALALSASNILYVGGGF